MGPPAWGTNAFRITREVRRRQADFRPVHLHLQHEVDQVPPHIRATLAADPIKDGFAR